MRVVAGLILCAILAGCAAAPIGYRDASAPIASITRFEAARFAGPWQMRAAFGAAPSGVVFTESDGAIMSMQFMGEGAATTMDQTRPARFETPQGPLWVLWVDEAYRTAVIGTPDGRLGWVIDRNATGGADRIRAARSLLEFNGYDLAQLRELGQ